eukprot:6183137-Pleurochrysis_carterae.AAC.3
MRDRMRTNAFDARAALSEVLARELMRASLRATLYGCARTCGSRSTRRARMAWPVARCHVLQRQQGVPFLEDSTWETFSIADGGFQQDQVPSPSPLGSDARVPYFPHAKAHARVHPPYHAGCYASLCLVWPSSLKSR